MRILLGVNDPNSANRRQGNSFGPNSRLRLNGVAIARADVKDLVFPGNLQEIMNRVLAAERMSEAQLVEARTKAEVQKIVEQKGSGMNGTYFRPK
jgi:regulator of protease activity HflC (stomatin/prohibitin superfamily)